MITGHSHDFFTTFHGKIVFLDKKSSLFICVYILPVWYQKPFRYRLFSVVCYVYGSCTNSYLFFICGTFSDAIPKPLIFLSNSLLCFFQPDKKPCLPLKLITFRISSCIIWCIWCKSRLRECVLQSDYLLNYNLYYWISQSD